MFVFGNCSSLVTFTVNRKSNYLIEDMSLYKNTFLKRDKTELVLKVRCVLYTIEGAKVSSVANYKNKGV